MDPETVPSTDAEILSGFDAAIAEVTEAPVEAAPEVEIEPEAPVPGTEEAPAAAKPEGEGDAAAVVDPNAPPAGEPEKVEPDKAVEEEITALGLKEKSAARFRELSSEVRELAPLKDVKAQLEKAGVTDLAQLPALLERSKAADDMIAMVMDTGATPEQYGNTLDYIKLTNAALSGDREAAEKAFDLIGKEYAALATALGKDIPGLVDPLAEHQDLLDEIEAGDLTRRRALEIVQVRNGEKLAAQARDQRGQQTQAETAAQQAIDEGRAALIEFDKAMLTADPTYAARRGALDAKVAVIRKQFPPSQWATQAALALATIPVPAAAPPAKPLPGPMRNNITPQAPATLLPETDDPMAALEQGIAAANG